MKNGLRLRFTKQARSLREQPFRVLGGRDRGADFRVCRTPALPQGLQSVCLRGTGPIPEVIDRRCEKLESRFLNRTEEYIGLVERQSRMFLNKQARAARELDAKIGEAKAARAKALEELHRHEDSHRNKVRLHPQ
ncbi:MAG: hypothetical protein DMF60_03755 [Acidobacteria bacterium]|nr:MAG: hypothetical protein DMF60_03755 [Acidobacteriota bacterium]